MCRLLDKLYVGRERGLELSGAIAAAQNYAAGGMGGGQNNNGQNGNGQHGIAAMAGMMPAAAMAMARGGGGPAGNRNGHGPYGAPTMMMQYPPNAGSPGPGPTTNVPKLPPVKPSGAFPQHGAYDGQPAATASPPTHHQQHQRHASHQQRYTAGSSDPGQGQLPDGLAYTQSVQGMGGGGGGDPYSHAQGKFLQQQAAADAQGQGQQAVAGKEQRAGRRAANGKSANGGGGGGNNGGNSKKPDRFAEGEKDAQRIAAMAKRWN